MGQVKEILKQYKWVLLAGVIVAILVTLITANFHVLQFMKYKISNDTTGIVSTLQTSVAGKRQDEWYFKQGMEYLLNQEEYTDEIRTFFETNFAVLSEEDQVNVLKGYNTQKLFLPMNKEFMNFLISNKDNDAVKMYMQRITPEEMEEGLVLAYGNNPVVDETFMSNISTLLSTYPSKLPFEKFQFSLYDLLGLENEANIAQIKSIFGKIETEKARTSLFKELQSKKVTEQEIVEWVKLLKDINIVTLSEYTTFDGLYSEICVIRSQYQGMDEETIALQNKKESVEAQIKENQDKLATKQQEINSMQAQVSEDLTSYTYMPLYVEKASGTGSNEYIASIPRGGLFGGLKPSSQKYVLKLTSSGFVKEGVYNVNVYLKGSKTTSDGSQYAYYEEVSSSDINNIEVLTTEHDNKVASLNTLKQEAATLEANIEAVKKENNYDEVVEALNSVDTRRNEYINKVNEKVAGIKELFGLSSLEIAMDASESKEKTEVVVQ